jgi:hypothetical protein
MKVWRLKMNRPGFNGFYFILPLFACILALCVAGCAQVNHETAAQNQQTRPRTVEAANTNVKEKNQGMSEASKENLSNNALPSTFQAALEKALTARGTTPGAVCDESDPVARRVLADYGAMFVASQSVQPPPVCVFTSEAEVLKFQNAAGAASATIAGSKIELQPAAMEALLQAREEARKAGLDITPRDGTEAARRGYEDTRRLWDTRFLPALAHWRARGRLTKEQVARLRALPLSEQVREVLELEKSGIFFSKDFSKSILYSIAAPGTSQHIAMLALDVSQFADARVRRILARHGWFQTVKSDLPHFTFLGVTEEALPSLGLKSVTSDNQLFWIPNMEKQG